METGTACMYSSTVQSAKLTKFSYIQGLESSARALPEGLVEPEERKNVPVPVPGISKFRDTAVLEDLPGYGTGGPSAPTRRYLVNAALLPPAVCCVRRGIQRAIQLRWTP